MLRICPACGHGIPEYYTICPYCKESVTSAEYCQNYESNDDVSYGTYTGYDD